MKKIEIDTFLKFRFLSNPHFSPDGTKIAFTVSVPDRETVFFPRSYKYRSDR